MKRSLIIISILVASFSAEAQLKALIIDGQNNHVVWPKSTIMMKQYLEETGLFEVDIVRSQYTWKAEREKDFLPLAGVGETENLETPKADPKFSPKFKKYDVVISVSGDPLTLGWNRFFTREFYKLVREHLNPGGIFSILVC